MVWLVAHLQRRHVFFAIFWFGQRAPKFIVPVSITTIVRGGRVGLAPVARIRLLTIIELFGFAVLLVFMIMMRFGY